VAKGQEFPSEARESVDARTGARIRQVTDHPSIHHQPFFFVPAYDRAMRRLIFISHRTGRPEIFAEDRSTGRLVQLTERAGIQEWSVYPSRDGRFVLYTAGMAGWRLDLATLEERCLVEFSGAAMRSDSMVGSGMGTTALSWDSRWWAVPVKAGSGFRFYVVDTESGAHHVAIEREEIGHPQFCPDDPDLILYLAGMNERIWVTSRDGRANRRIYSRNAARKEWITHESWLAGRREITFVDWPHGVRAIHVDALAERSVCRFNAWHAMPDWQGRRMVADTNFPDIGLQLFDALDGVGAPRTLCLPEASSMGAHWAGPYPYENGPVKVCAPQHTHPHPSFAPDGSRIVYTSDRTGHAQVYECLLTE